MKKAHFRPEWYLDRRFDLPEALWLPEAHFIAALSAQWNNANEGWETLSYDVQPKHLTTPEGRFFYKALLEYRNSSRIFDPSSPHEFLQELGSRLPGHERELQIAIWPLFASFSTLNANHWARLTLVDYYEAKRESMVLELKTNPSLIDDLYELNKTITGLRSAEGQDALSSLASVSAQRYRDKKEKQMEDGSSETVLKTGYERFDSFLRLKPGDLVVVGGRSGSGKSYFAIELAKRYCEQGKKVGFISVEMEEVRVIDGFVANISGLNIDAVGAPDTLNDEQKILLADASYVYQSYPLSISDKRQVNLLEMKRIMLNMERQLGGLDVVFLDHMHTLDDDAPGLQIREKLIAISKTIRAYAKEFNCTFIALAQLNRSIDSRQTDAHIASGAHLPQVSDFRESSSIEQDADYILMIYRDNYQSQGGSGLTEIYCRKSRYSGTGANWCVKFKHDVATKTFKEVYQ